MSQAVVRKLAEAFKKVSEGPEFQEVLNRFDLPYDYKDRTQLEKETLPEYEMIGDYLKKIGVAK
jgi:tripartite-type tricarboxylate transporter receptor subunit TctC